MEITNFLLFSTLHYPLLFFSRRPVLITKYFFWSMGNYPQTAWITQQDYLLTKYLNHGVRIQKFKLKSTKTKTIYRSPIAIKVQPMTLTSCVCCCSLSRSILAVTSSRARRLPFRLSSASLATFSWRFSSWMCSLSFSTSPCSRNLASLSFIRACFRRVVASIAVSFKSSPSFATKKKIFHYHFFWH